MFEIIEKGKKGKGKKCKETGNQLKQKTAMKKKKKTRIQQFEMRKSLMKSTKKYKMIVVF